MLYTVELKSVFSFSSHIYVALIICIYKWSLYRGGRYIRVHFVFFIWRKFGTKIGFGLRRLK